MPSCSVFMCKKRSESSSLLKDNVTFHLFPRAPGIREAWIRACGNHRTWAPKPTSTVCSVHFNPALFVLQANNKRKLKHGAVPTLRISESPDDTESPTPEIPVTVKLEVEEQDFSEHEEDVMEQLERRKRLLENDPIAIDTKRVKAEPDATQSEQEYQYEIHSKNKCTKHSQTQTEGEPVVIPEFFMNVVVQNQMDTLKILKQQVLLQDPNPEMLTFLRFLGAKLMRLPKNKRDDIQDKITDLVFLE